MTLHNLRNGQFGDNTGVEDGVIVDQGGPGQPVQGSVMVPTMTEWGMSILTLLVAAIAVYRLIAGGGARATKTKSIDIP